MERNRIAAELDAVHLPQPAALPLCPAGFVLCSLGAFPAVAVEQWLCQQWLYMQAFQEAQAVVRPSLPERDLLAVWN
jgi:hypothetical protein